jgi:K+/H+ antiporter YhaU regulatory subunit KhtT
MVAGAVLEVISTGEYRDERLYLLETVKRLEKKLDATLEQLAVSKADLVKFRTDLNGVGDRGRTLTSAKDKIEQRLLRMEMRSGLIASVVGIVTAGAIEFIFRYLAK